MTGFGRAKDNFGNKTISVEIKSLNGRSSDVRCRIPNNYSDKEILIRQMVLEDGIRGKFDVQLEIQSLEGDSEYSIDSATFKKYYNELIQLQEELGISASSDIIQAILRIPNVVSTSHTEVDPDEWEKVKEIIGIALEQLKKFRITEGQVMLEDLKSRVIAIQELLTEVVPHEQARIENLKERFNKNLQDFISNETIDKNRYEQEILYYLEKLDINEEKIRLAQHCTYFLEELRSTDIEVGKKLSFITQEMGREINTLGAKAQHKDIQRIVVNMKDQLEKIKEQLANII